MKLSDSDGIIIDVDHETFNLEHYYKRKNFKPTKDKLYIICKEKLPFENEIFPSEGDNDDKPNYVSSTQINL
jgi:hypothetical protein